MPAYVVTVVNDLRITIQCDTDIQAIEKAIKRIKSSENVLKVIRNDGAEVSREAIDRLASEHEF